MLEENKIHLGDCLELLPTIADKSVDMILCDLPYGTTACEWDSIIDMARLWQEYERVIKDNGAIVLTANSVFTFKLYNSNPKIFKYKQVWDKIIKVGHLSANRIPMRQHEDVLLFCRGTPPYFPQMSKGAPYTMKRNNRMESVAYLGGSATKRSDTNNNGERYPSDIIQIASAVFSKDKGQHPTQKPVALFEYLIKTYSNENELVLDNCSGSGTTAIACMNTNRRFICIERDETYHRKSIERMNNHEPLFHLGST